MHVERIFNFLGCLKFIHSAQRFCADDKLENYNLFFYNFSFLQHQSLFIFIKTYNSVERFANVATTSKEENKARVLRLLRPKVRLTSRCYKWLLVKIKKESVGQTSLTNQRPSGWPHTPARRLTGPWPNVAGQPKDCVVGRTPQPDV